MKLLRMKPAPISAEEASAKLEAVLDTAVDAIITTDAWGTIESFNRAAVAMFGYEAHEAIGRNVSILVPEPHGSRHDQYMRAYVDTGNAQVLGRRREINAQRRDGSEFPIELALSAADVGGRRIFTGIISDISRRSSAEAELSHYRGHLEQMVADRTAALENTQEALRSANAKLKQMVRIDELTGIGNRRAFDERLAIEWRRQQRNGNPLSIVICDVDMFKLYNDHYGHPAGDVCLRRIATVFGECFQRAAEFAARYGGEEFAAILSNTDLQAANERAEILRKNVHNSAIEHDGLEAGSYVTISVGVASQVPARSVDPITLVEAADAALYRAKQSGRNCVKVARESILAVSEIA
ncbi:MAG: diguanylate cyclase [Gammaproteobacteria bacterium]|nr:diguanylate cyclase [Gammaproteobacteria bacterium]MDH3767547.1 diguanylate cyclase [Gammaproteobacteria bacterium]